LKLLFVIWVYLFICQTNALLCQFLPRVEFEYNALEELTLLSPDECCQRCSSNPSCVAFSFYLRTSLCSIKHSESPALTDRGGVISGRKAPPVEPPPLPGAVPLSLFTLENSELTIYLFGADIPENAYQSQILTLPRIGALYEVVDKGVRQLITQVPYIMSDPKHRVKYVLHESYGNDSFDFAIMENLILKETATAFIQVMPNKRLTCSDPQNMGASHNVTIGEMKKILLTHEETKVTFDHQFVNPIVLAQPLGWNERNSSALARITKVSPNGFTIKIQEPPSSDGTHASEEISYLAMEVGSWRLQDGTRIEAGKVVTDATVGVSTADNTWEIVQFPSSTLFSKAPTVISQVQTSNDFHWVNTRQQSVSTSGFAVTLEEEEANLIAHGGEIVGWLAIQAGLGVWSGHRYEIGIEMDVDSKRGDWWHLLSFKQQFNSTPLFVAMMTTFDDTDPAHLRYRALTDSSVQIRIEEDQEYDWERTHGNEQVSFIAMDTSSVPPGNSLALQGIPAECFYIPTSFDLISYALPERVSLITLKDENERKEVYAVLLTLPKKGTLFQYQPQEVTKLNKTITETNIKVEDLQARVLYQAYDINLLENDDVFTYQLQDDYGHVSNVATVSIKYKLPDDNPVLTEVHTKTEVKTYMVIVGLVGFMLSAVVIAFFGIFLYKRNKAWKEFEGFLSLADNVTDEDGGTIYYPNSEKNIQDIENPEVDLSAEDSLDED